MIFISNSRLSSAMQPEVGDLPRNDLTRIRGLSDNEIDFLGYSESYFVCFVDIVNSTSIVSTISNSSGIRKYYGIFLNTLARIAREFGGKIVKSTGDSLILYFPDTSDAANAHGFRTAMKCCLEMLDAHTLMNLVANYERLPKIDYRVSADYGKVEVAKSRSSTEYDLIGHTMNICSKMNSRARPQGFVIGSDLYEVLKRIGFPFWNYYDFQPVGEYSTGLRYNYPIFTVEAKDGNRDLLKIHDVSAPVSGLEGRRHRIMIIDDEPDVLLTYKSMLDDDELFEVETCASSQEALKHLFSRGLDSYDLIITDIRMPPPNGLQLYNIIKSLDKRAQVLFITAYDVIEEVVSLLPDVRHEHVLKKPINKHDLLKEARLCIA